MVSKKCWICFAKMDEKCRSIGISPILPLSCGIIVPDCSVGHSAQIQSEPRLNRDIECKLPVPSFCHITLMIYLRKYI
jgi:hypothetical protein